MRLKQALHTDHLKVGKLFEQIDSATDAETIKEYFTELATELEIHATAEEEVVYPLARSFVYDEVGENYEEHAKVKETLEALEAMDFSSAEFKAKVKQLHQAVQTHVEREESDMMECFDREMTDQEQAEVVEQFEAAKTQLKEQLAA